jgi:hypothetical protein
MTLEYILELQARPGGRVGRCWNIQEGGETDGLPWPVDASCEVGDGLCRDILCLVRWVGVRLAVGPSGARDRSETERRGGRPRAMGEDQSHSLCGMGSTGFLEMSRCRKVSRVPDRGEQVVSG